MFRELIPFNRDQVNDVNYIELVFINYYIHEFREFYGKREYHEASEKKNKC